MDPTSSGTISQVQLPSGQIYDIQDTISGYPIITINDGTETLIITTSAINADQEEY